MTGGFLDSFSGALDGVTEADVAAFTAQDRDVQVEDHAPPPRSEPAAAVASTESLIPDRVVPVVVRDAADALLAGSMFVTAAPSGQQEITTLWVHTDVASQQILFGEPILLGRRAPVGATNFLRIESDKVSREHCGVRVLDGVATCVDLGSTNGTWIDRGDRVLEVHGDPVELRAGDKICTMGNRIVLAQVSTTNEQP